MNERLKLGEIMLRAGVIDEMQLVAALGEQKKWGSRLGLVMIRLGYATEHQIVQAVASQLDVPVATLDGKKIPDRVLSLVPYDYADAHTCLPLFLKEEEGVETLYVAMDDPSNLEVLDDLEFRSGMPVKPVVAATSEIGAAIDRCYRHIVRAKQERESESAYFGSLTELVPTEDDDGFDVFSFVGQTDRSPFQDMAAGGGEEAGASRGGSVAVEKDPDAARIPDANATARSGDEPSTRRILHALTQLLIEKGLVSREEIFYRVQTLAAREEEDRKEAQRDDA